MSINKQDALNKILAKQETVWAENRDKYPKPGKRKSVLCAHKPSETENCFNDFQTKMNAKMHAEKTCLEWSRQLVVAETEDEKLLIMGALEKALAELDRHQI